MSLPTDLCALILTYTLNIYPKSIPEDIVRKAYKMEMKSRGLKTDELDFQDFQARREILNNNEPKYSMPTLIFSRLNNIKYWESVYTFYEVYDASITSSTGFNMFRQNYDPVDRKVKVIHGDVIEHYANKEIAQDKERNPEHRSKYHLSYGYQWAMIQAIIRDMCAKHCENKVAEHDCFKLGRHLFEFLKDEKYFDKKCIEYLVKREGMEIYEDLYEQGQFSSDPVENEEENFYGRIYDTLDTHGVVVDI